MDEDELEQELDQVILESELPASDVVGVLELMLERYRDDARSKA